MTTRLVIVGAGGHGRETLDIVEACNEATATPAYEFVGFVATEADPSLLERRGAQLLGDVGDLKNLDARYVLGIGTSETRRELDARLSADSCEAVTLVHPHATCGSDLRIASGVLMAAGARVTTNIELGRHTHLNVNAVVSHDCVVGDYVTLSPGVLINGNVVLEEGVFLGTGAVVLPGRRIGAWARIGAGAVVTDDVPPGATAVGVPARVLPG
jgi:sugar O-acyltransferase (sialic acid O-acetyltransferase NeuD family)